MFETTDGGQRTDRVPLGDQPRDPAYLEPFLNHRHLVGEHLVIGPGPPARDLGHGPSGERGRQGRGGRGVGEPDLTGHQHVGSGVDGGVGGLDTDADRLQGLLHGHCGPLGEVGGAGRDAAVHGAGRVLQQTDVEHLGSGPEGPGDHAHPGEPDGYPGGHLDADLLGPRRDPLRVDPVVGGENDHLRI